MNLGKSLRELRKKAGFKNQTLAAEAIGTTQSYLAQLECGNNFPKAEMLEAISKAYSVPVPFIFYWGWEESDIKPEKLEIFKTLQPMIDKMLEEAM